MMKKSILVIAVIFVMLLCACAPAASPAPAQPAGTVSPSAAASGAPVNEPEPVAVTKLTITAPGFATDVLNDSSPILLALEQYTNTDLTVNFIPDKSYSEKFNAMLAGNTLTEMMYVPNFTNSTILMACEAGAFWQLDEWIDQFENLSQANKDILKYASVEGKLYGLPRDRNPGRLGVQYRADWLDNLGLEVPTTIDAFYDLCVAFTQDDPDGNGQNDTYAVSEQSSMGAVGTILGWFGCPKNYAVDDNGNITSMYDTQQYIDGVTFWRTLYTEGLMNQDFISLSSRSDNLRSGVAGMTLGAMDDATNNLTQLQALYPDARIDVIPAIDAGAGMGSVWSENPGFKGYYGFPTSANKTSEQLMAALQFVDRLNTVEMNNLLQYGIEQLHYTLNADGTISISPEQSAQRGVDANDLGQLRTFNLTVNPYDLVENKTEMQQAISDAIALNGKTCIFDPVSGLQSATYSEKGSDLNNIMKDAQAKYIMGQISLDELKSAIEQWHSQGGTLVCQEYSESYRSAYGQ
jgi:putative aldouronate transport system substrate-binding protein